jgi:DNA polymerase III subunit gamma/tau
MLLKGWEETGRAPNAKAAAEMVVIRLAHTADLPSPDELIRTLGGGEALARGAGKPAPRDNGSSRDSALERANAAEPAVESSSENLEAIDDVPVEEPTSGAIPDPRSFADVVALVAERRDAKLKVHL